MATQRHTPDGGDLRGRGSNGVHASILSGAVRVAMGTGFVFAAGFLKEIQVAASFGLSSGLDLYLLVLAVAVLGAGLLSGAFQISFVPAWSKAAAAGEERQSLLSAAVTMALAAGGALWAAAIFVLPEILPLLSSSLERTGAGQTRQLAVILGSLLVISPVNGLAHGVLQSERRFFLSSLLPALSHVAAFTALFAAGEHATVTLLAVAVAAGLALETAALAVLLKMRGLLLTPGRFSGPRERRLLSHAGRLALASMFMSCTVLVDRAMAAVLGEGSVAALSYGDRVPNLIRGLGSVALATAVLPFYSEQAAAGDWRGARRVLNRFTLLALAAGVPITIAAVAFSEDIIRLLFVRGEFDAADAALVSQVQTAYLFQAPTNLAAAVSMRLLAAFGRTGAIARATATALAVNVVGNLVLMRFFGVAGIAWSTAAVNLFIFLATQMAARRVLASEHPVAAERYASPPSDEPPAGLGG
ncbi:MAG: murein biosynthesis integral membrane protein MurJ [Oceanidesulfovibrio sp.]